MKRLLIFLLLFITVIITPSMAFAQGMMGNGGWNNMTGGWGGFGFLGWLPMLLFWILLILGVVALFRYLGGSGKKSNEDKSPLDILKERYARGEINKKEFEEKKRDLTLTISVWTTFYHLTNNSPYPNIDLFKCFNKEV